MNEREREIVNTKRGTQLTVQLSNVELISFSLMSVSILTCKEIMKHITGSGGLSQEPFLHTFLSLPYSTDFNIFYDTKQTDCSFSLESDAKSVLCSSHSAEMSEWNLP